MGLGLTVGGGIWRHLLTGKRRFLLCLYGHLGVGGLQLFSQRRVSFVPLLCVPSGGPVYLPHHHVPAGQEHPVSL